MNFPRFIERALHPPKAPMIEFGMTEFEFFAALLRVCPDGARIEFDRSEPESFVRRFERWAHRDDAREFEADYYVVDRGFVEAVEQAIAVGDLELWHHLSISGSDGQGLFQGIDDFCDIYLDENLRRRIHENQIGEQASASDGG